jgi:hypothetical protein
MSDKLREAAQAALKLLDDDDRDCAFAARILKAALAEQTVKESLTVAEQEPVACIKTNGELMWLKKPSTIYSKPRPLYAAPPRREWVGLTDEEIDEISRVVIGFNSLSGWENEFGLAIEAKLREKNT